jgi:hypothetical protein
MRNLAVVELDFATIGKLLQLPKGQAVCRAEYDIARDSLRILIEGDGLPGIPPSCTAMTIRPIVSEVARLEFSWPQKT